jgi:hypothetical protein
MLKHYSNHTINGDIERIHQAQLTAFSKLLPEKINSDFNLPKQERDAHGHFLAYNVKAA